MNISVILGFIVAGLVLWFGVFVSMPNPKLFLDPHALILVIGGTLSAALIGFPIKRLLSFFNFFISGVLFKKKLSNPDLGEQIFRSYAFHKDGKLDQFYADTHYHPFLVESVRLMSRNSFEDHELTEILETRIDQVKNEYLSDAKILNALAKFPPAFGLLGASTGMIVMMTRLGSGGAETIGPAMAIALVATFWGIAVANMIFLPLSDYANKAATDEAKQRKMIADAVIAMNNECSYAFLVEKTISHVPLLQRLAFKSKVKNYLAELSDSRKNIQTSA